MQTERILVMEANQAVSNTICHALEADGLMADPASSEIQTMKKLEDSRYSLVLLDLIPRNTTGFEIIKSVRAADSRVPVIVTSDHAQDNDKIFALTIGADDYITQPYSTHFICAKIKAMLRRYKLESVNEIKAYPFRYLLDDMQLFKHNQEIFLTAKESKMMLHFLKKPGSICSKEELYRHVWGNEFVDNNTIMVYISNLRKKIENNPNQPEYIETVRGKGYRFHPDPPPS